MSGWTQKSKLTGKGLLWVAALAAGFLSPAQKLAAQGAARLSSVEGQVQISQNGQQIADQALQNTPLFDATQITTANDGKVEIQFEDGTVARLAPNGLLTLASLNGQQGAELVLTQGLGYFEVPAGAQGQLNIRFGTSLLTAGAGTVLRIRMDTPPGELAVFAGQVHLSRAGGLELDLHASQSVLLDPSVPSRYNLANSIEPDSWDGWNQDRDQELNNEATQQTNAASTITGENTSNPAWSTLDANGVWYNIPDQGYVWSPYEASSAGWDPYGCGHWMWTPGYGYVWVSCERWGFMPYMCGSWNYFSDFGWGWQPGLGSGCGARWGRGYSGGIIIARAPRGYDPIRRPIGPRRPIGRVPAPIGIVRRGPSDGPGFPPRDRNREIGGTFRPLPPSPPSGVRFGDHGRDSRGGFGQAPGQGFGQRPGQRPGQGDNQRPGQGFGQRPGQGNGQAPSGQGPGQGAGPGAPGRNNSGAVPPHSGAHIVDTIPGPGAAIGGQNPGNGQNPADGHNQRNGGGAGFNPPPSQPSGNPGQRGQPFGQPMPAPTPGTLSTPRPSAPSQGIQPSRGGQSPQTQPFSPPQQQPQMQQRPQQLVPQPAPRQNFQPPSQPAPQRSAPSAPPAIHSNFGGGAPMHSAPPPPAGGGMHSGGNAPAVNNNHK